VRSGLILRTYIVLCIGHVSTKAVAFVTAVLMGRMVGPAEMGVFATALTLASLALVLVNGGSDILAIRRVATDPRDVSAALSSVVSVRLTGAILVVAFVLLGARFFGPYQGLAIPLSLALLAYVFRLDWLLLVRDQPRWITASTVCREGAYLLLVVLFVAHAKSAVGAAWAFCIAEWIWSGMTLLAAKSWEYWPKFRPDWRAVPGALRAGWPIAAMALLNLTYNKIDTPMVAAIVGTQSAGVYWAAYSIIFGLMGFAAVLTRAAFPEMARDGIHGRVETADQVLRFCALMSLVGCGLSVILNQWSGRLMVAAYGEAFRPGASALSILGWCLWPAFGSGLLTHWLIARGRQVRVAGIALAAVLANLALNCFMIPLFGIRGAAMASVVAEVCVLLGASIWLRDVSGIAGFLGMQLWILGAGLLVTFGFEHMFPASPLLGPLALAAYCIICLPVLRRAIRTFPFKPVAVRTMAFLPHRNPKSPVEVGKPETSRPRMLAIVQLPPPVHGVTKMNEVVVRSTLIHREYEVSVLELRFADRIDDLGRMRPTKILRALGCGLRLLLRCVRDRPQIAYFTLAPTGLAFFRDLLYVGILKTLHVRRVLHLHGLGMRRSSTGAFTRALYRWAFDGAYVVHLSEAGRTEVAEMVGRNACLLPNGVDDIGRDEWARERRMRTGVPRILFLSNMLEQKGALVLLEALRELAGRGYEFQAQFVGTACDPKLEERFSAMRVEWSLEARTCRLTECLGDTKRALFQDADLFVFPSYYECECFPLVVLEAMAAGLPVIATRHASIPEMVLEGRTGSLVDPRSVEDLATAIALLLRDPEARFRMGSAGRARFQAHYTTAMFENRLLQILRDAAGAPVPIPNAEVPERDFESEATERAMMSRRWVSVGARGEPLSLAIFQRVVPEYRVRVFERIAEQTNYNITLYATRFAAKPAGVECREVGEIPLGRLRVHPKVVSTILRGRHDVFLCEGSISLFASLSAAVRAFRRGTALVWWTSMWRPNGVIGPGRGARRLFVHRVLRAADAVATYSGVAAEVVRAAGVPEDRIFVAYNSLDTAHLREAEREWNTEGKLETFRKDERLGTRPTILFVGRLIREKRVRDLLRAVKRLSATEDFELLIVGDGPDRRTCERLAQRLELKRHVRFLGEIRDEVALCPYFLSARALVLPGPGGLAINQAFTYGLPVIVGRGDGTEQDLIVDGENGFVLPNGSAEAIADGMARILALTESEHRSFSRAARERVDRVANVDTMVTGLIDAVRAARSMRPVRT
jgi:glycosyltransferase involved in cell wall biosynthesis/O-antigen/teichoic acid export membrane protein